MKRAHLGEILIQMGAIDPLQLQAGLAHHRQWGTPLGRTLVERQLCSEESVMSALAQQTRLPLVDLDEVNLSANLASIVSRKVAEQHRVVPLRLEGKRGDVLVIAIAAPASLEAIDAVQSVSKRHRIVAQLASDESIDRAINRLYHPAAAARAGWGPAGQLGFELDASVLAGPRNPVLIYGCTESAGRTIALMLSAEGIAARVVGAEQVFSAGEDDVLLSPLPSIDALLKDGKGFRGQLIVVAKQPEEDLEAASRLGARGFLTAPLDAELLIRSVRRCQRERTLGQAVA